MPLVTSCPECNTQFVVKKEQLKAFDGQVRCGTCEHVFNAKTYLIKQTRAKKAPPTRVEAVLSDISLNPDTLPETTEHIEVTVRAYLQEQPLENQDSHADTGTGQASSQIPSFLNDLSVDASFDKRQRKPAFSWAYFALSMLLLLVLMAQSVYFMRTKIVALYPQTKPLFTQACHALKCTVPLPQQIDLLTIDDSDMQEHLTYQHVLIFSSTLINHANFAQAYPNIELTLTNTEDEPVLRRTFKASDYLQSPTSSTLGIAAKEEVRIKLPLNTSDIAVAGYRVSLHYPA